MMKKKKKKKKKMEDEGRTCSSIRKLRKKITKLVLCERRK